VADDAGDSPFAKTRRRVAEELLAAAARHAVISDELYDLEKLREERPLAAKELARLEQLRAEKLLCRLRHRRAHARLVRLTASSLRGL